MEAWHDFFVAVAGAAAALTGLIFVGVSLSLTKMLAIPRLADRASEALMLLMTVLIISCLCLAPAQPYALRRCRTFVHRYNGLGRHTKA